LHQNGRGTESNATCCFCGNLKKQVQVSPHAQDYRSLNIWHGDAWFVIGFATVKWIWMRMMMMVVVMDDDG
jgi:hypothetical protein